MKTQSSAASRHGLATARHPLARAHHMFGTAEEGDPPMPRLDQVPTGQETALVIVAEHLRAARALDIFVQDHDAPVRSIDRDGQRPVARMMVTKIRPSRWLRPSLRR